MQNYNLIQGVHSADSEECVRATRAGHRDRAPVRDAPAVAGRRRSVARGTPPPHNGAYHHISVPCGSAAVASAGPPEAVGSLWSPQQADCNEQQHRQQALRYQHDYQGQYQQRRDVRPSGQLNRQ
jgi:hypothetical protein